MSGRERELNHRDCQHSAVTAPELSSMPRMSLLYQLPNLLTLLRIGAVPVLILFLYEGRYGAALVVFVIAGITDGLDGWIAKRFDAVTRLGSILDPLADTMLIVSTYVMLTLAGDIPFWLLLLILSLIHI